MKNEFSLNQCDDIALLLLEEAQSKSINQDNATVIALSGDLGAGKTTLTKSIAKVLGVHEVITSPTFVIASFYDIPEGGIFPWKKLIHMDAYRLEDEKQLAPLHYDQWISDPDTIVVIEWPELIKKAIPVHAMNISLVHKSEDMRSIEW